MGNPELRSGRSDELVSDSGGPPGRKRDTEGRCTAQGPWAGRRRAAETSGTREEGGTETDTGHQEEGGTETREKDATAPLPGTHVHARTASGQPGGESLFQSTGVCALRMHAEEERDRWRARPGTIFSSTSTLL